VQFNDAVTECPPEKTTVTLGATSSTLTANAGGTGTTSSSQGDPQLSQSGVDTTVSGNSYSKDSSGNNGNQGGASEGNDPQGPDPNVNLLEKIAFTYRARGGPLAQWGIIARLTVADMV